MLFVYHIVYLFSSSPKHIFEVFTEYVCASVEKPNGKRRTNTSLPTDPGCITETKLLQIFPKEYEWDEVRHVCLVVLYTFLFRIQRRTFPNSVFHASLLQCKWIEELCAFKKSPQSIECVVL